jgi:hypothetical protein
MLHSGQDGTAGSRFRPLIPAGWALAAMLVFLLWQFLTVHYNRGGNWTALFLTGQDFTVPPELKPGTYLFPGKGYDGEMYRYVAHDVLRERGYERYIDGPAQRYRRLLIPALAYLLAGGYQPWIDASYIAVVALFVFLGSYWLSRWAVLSGAHPAWALGFLATPAAVISMDRMTVDVALAAFTVGFAVYLQDDSRWKLFVVLLLACLVRETGLLLVGGMWLFDLARRQFARVALWTLAALPMLAWYWFIRGTFTEKTRFGAPTWFANKWGLGLIQRMFEPPRYPLPPFMETVARGADSLALLGILLAAILAIVFFFRSHPKDPLVISGVLYTLLVFALTNRRYWNDVNGYGRAITPLLILVALPSIAPLSIGKGTGSALPRWLGLVPTILVTGRLGIEFTSAIGGVIRGLL